MPKITDPEIYQELKRIHNIAQRPKDDGLSDEERWKRKEIRDNNKINQAR